MKKMETILPLWLLIMGFVSAETIHFTNSLKHLQTTKNFTTYEVEVPGSRPITIIEANPEDPPELTSRPPAVVGRYRNNAAVSVEDLKGSRNKNDGGDNVAAMAGGSLKKTLYSPDLLNKFLREYSEKLKNADSSTRQKLNEITLINTKKPLTNDSDKKVEDEQGKEDEFNFSDVDERNNGNGKWYGDNRKDHPWNSKQGWVTMEAVPWSASKVSKWQSNNSNKKGDQNRVQSNYHGTHWNDNDTADMYARPKPLLGSIASQSNSYYGHSEDDDYSDTPYSSGGRPTYSDEKLFKPSLESFYNRRYQPAEDYDRKSYQPPTSESHAGDTWYDHGFKKLYDNQHHRPDIITDGRMPQFPAYAPPVLRPSRFPSDRNHPQSYPENGNGEWILISTTKGYQYPRRHGQRAITFSPNAVAHKSVKLTVLPMKNTQDMTTSHNGLIEVASSTQTVEQSYKDQQKKTKLQPATTQAPPIRKRRVLPQISLMRQDVPDSSAVLAAVGAGMVPAALAVLAPMVLGRRRREADTGAEFRPPLAAPTRLQ
ncbi:uncharacterized protein LOC129748365 [Uranotaenia lowii]|uniref:uncharacterized protein LOC129748365 n=1 Tax=Uranotaenia lowii TaxID=190385 RepID=UPI00247AEB91|nr:uncharacterized protein LOC129748365 [Uranotaenia lowii]